MNLFFLCWLETDCTGHKLDVSTKGIQWHTWTEVTSENLLKEPAAWVYSVTPAGTVGILHSLPSLRSMLWLCALLMDTHKNLWSSWYFWRCYWNLLDFSVCFWWLSIFALGGSLCPPLHKDGTWGEKQHYISHFWIQRQIVDELANALDASTYLMETSGKVPSLLSSRETLFLLEMRKEA